MSCEACDDKRLHTEKDWENHPLRGQGFNREQKWTSEEARRLHELEKER